MVHHCSFLAHTNASITFCTTFDSGCNGNFAHAFVEILQTLKS